MKKMIIKIVIVMGAIVCGYAGAQSVEAYFTEEDLKIIAYSKTQGIYIF